MPQESFGAQVFVNPDIDREEFEREFLAKFPGGGFKFCGLLPDAHEGQNMYELWVPMEQGEEVLPWFAEYWRQRGCHTSSEPASGFGWIHSG